jgi:hypothetical protein
MMGVAALMASLVGATGGGQAVHQTPVQAQTKAPEEKKICKRVGDEDAIGTRLGRSKVCKTALEWQRERERSERN